MIAINQKCNDSSFQKQHFAHECLIEREAYTISHKHYELKPLGVVYIRYELLLQVLVSMRQQSGNA